MLPQHTVKRGTKRPARQKTKIKATWRLLSKAMCRCLKFPNAPNVCSCKTYTLFEQMLHQCEKKRPGWHQGKGERVSTNDATPNKQACDKCDGACHPGTLYRSFSSSPATAVRAICCKGIRQPHQAMPMYDKNDRRVVTRQGLEVLLRKGWRLRKSFPQMEATTAKIAKILGAFLPAHRHLYHPRTQCVLGDCTEGKCGLHNLFSKMNGGEPLPFTLDFEDKELHYCCPVEGTMDPMKWSKWLQVQTSIRSNLPLVHCFILLSIWIFGCAGLPVCCPITFLK